MRIQCHTVYGVEWQPHSRAKRERDSKNGIYSFARILCWFCHSVVSIFDGIHMLWMRWMNWRASCSSAKRQSSDKNGNKRDLRGAIPFPIAMCMLMHCSHLIHEKNAHTFYCGQNARHDKDKACGDVEFMATNKQTNKALKTKAQRMQTSPRMLDKN